MTNSDPFTQDNFAAEWDRACDADPTNDPDFREKAEAAGLIHLVPVDDDALDDSFAEERGIVPGGLMWELTEAGRARYYAGKEPIA